jgi:hypothetical protein
MTPSKRIGIPSNRIDTLKVIAASLLGNTIPCQKVLKEFEEVKRVDSMPIEEKIRRLLQILHSTRALDSTLAAFIKNYGYTDPSDPSKKVKSLYGYLHLICFGNPATANIRRLNESDLKKYQQKIVHERNRYMHEADAFPIDDLEIMLLLSEMNECLAKVFSLI